MFETKNKKLIKILIFCNIGCILRNISAGYWNSLLRLANCNHQKAEVNK